ncbi:MAG: restriction endonuclease [Kiritimatiellae bacterium]|nr:restriction endonuclease [Kiritimatiellia bacterium]
MTKLDQARGILEQLGVPPRQQSDICCYTLLALAGLKARNPWTRATNKWLRIHDIIRFAKDGYRAVYAENRRETFRKQALHHFRDAAFAEDNGLATNSPNYRYRLTDEMLALLQSHGKPGWGNALQRFLDRHGTLVARYASKREFRKMPVRINGLDLSLSPGAHNLLQKAVLEEFAPRFAPSSECLWLGDAEKKDLVNRTECLQELGFGISVHDKMPDIVLYRRDRDCLYFIEAVTSVGPMDSKRIQEINRMTRQVKAGKVFITAFPDMKTYRKFAASLAWETEVWLAEIPDHMIHLNGDKFLLPKEGRQVRESGRRHEVEAPQARRAPPRR